MGYRFVPECNDAQGSHTFSHVFVFPAIFVGPRFVEIQKLSYRGNMTYGFSSLLCDHGFYVSGGFGSFSTSPEQQVIPSHRATP